MGFRLPTKADFGVRSSAKGWAVARWTLSADMLRPGGYVPGPTLFGLADVALWFACFTVLGLEPMAVTSDLAIAFLRPAKDSDVLARATILRGRKIAHLRTGRSVGRWKRRPPGRPSPWQLRASARRSQQVRFQIDPFRHRLDRTDRRFDRVDLGGETRGVEFVGKLDLRSHEEHVWPEVLGAEMNEIANRRMRGDRPADRFSEAAAARSPSSRPRVSMARTIPITISRTPIAIEPTASHRGS